MAEVPVDNDAPLEQKSLDLVDDQVRCERASLTCLELWVLRIDAAGAGWGGPHMLPSSHGLGALIAVQQ